MVAWKRLAPVRLALSKLVAVRLVRKRLAPVRLAWFQAGPSQIQPTGVGVGQGRRPGPRRAPPGSPPPPPTGRQRGREAGDATGKLPREVGSLHRQPGDVGLGEACPPEVAAHGARPYPRSLRTSWRQRDRTPLMWADGRLAPARLSPGETRASMSAFSGFALGPSRNPESRRQSRGGTLGLPGNRPDRSPVESCLGEVHAREVGGGHRRVDRLGSQEGEARVRLVRFNDTDCSRAFAGWRL